MLQYEMSYLGLHPDGELICLYTVPCFGQTYLILWTALDFQYNLIGAEWRLLARKSEFN